MKYVKFKLSPGQSPPNDGKCLGVMIPNTDWLVWADPADGNFPNPSLVNALMDQAEIDSIQPDALLKTSSKINLTAGNDGDKLFLHALILVLLDAINTLRGLHSLPAITKVQARNALIAKIDALEKIQ